MNLPEREENTNICWHPLTLPLDPKFQHGRHQRKKQTTTISLKNPLRGKRGAAVVNFENVATKQKRNGLFNRRIEQS